MFRSSHRSLAMLAAAMMAPAVPACATWLQCVGSGSDGAGPFAYLTTLASVGPVSPARLTQFQARLVAYVAKADADAHGTQAQCFASDDQLTSNEHYSRLLNDAAARLGWDRVVVVAPRAWLGAGDIVDEPAVP